MRLFVRFNDKRLLAPCREDIVQWLIRETIRHWEAAGGSNKPPLTAQGFEVLSRCQRDPKDPINKDCQLGDGFVTSVMLMYSALHQLITKFSTFRDSVLLLKLESLCKVTKL